MFSGTNGREAVSGTRLVRPGGPLGAGRHPILRGLNLRVLKSEELGDPARESILGLGQLPVGVDDAPDGFDESEPLVTRKALGHAARELKEIDAVTPLGLGEPQRLLDLRRPDSHVARRARDAPTLLIGEVAVGMRELEQQRAGGDANAIRRRRGRRRSAQMTRDEVAELVIQVGEPLIDGIHQPGNMVLDVRRFDEFAAEVAGKDDFQEVVEQFPNTTYADAAKKELGTMK